ncbi:MAG TPA: hypothetical protein VLC09_00905 [Polyangiaceae bacterium]|nr:hypothetical protein [Polyangiaceae bacterium]
MKLRFASLGMVCLAVSAASFGCASLIGIGSPPAEDAGGDTGDDLVDDPSGVRTTVACQEYCDAVMQNCTGEFEQYTARIACVRACNTWEAGTASEPSGNTVACHKRFAGLAASQPQEQCGSAGPAGIGPCGGKCENWCGLLEAACPDNYAEMIDCQASCGALPAASGTYSSGTMQSGNSIECRIYHTNAALENEDTPATHCPHGKFMPDSQCVDPEGPLSCQVYCQNVMGACRGDNTQYESETDCLAACAVFDLGTIDDQNENTVGCRRYHSFSGLSSPNLHCPHAGPTGDGHCGSPTDDTGSCLSFCQLAEAACGTDFVGCMADCPATPGSEANAGYTVGKALEADDLLCRTYYAVKVLGDPTLQAELCAHVDLAGTCPAP